MLIERRNATTEVMTLRGLGFDFPLSRPQTRAKDLFAEPIALHEVTEATCRHRFLQLRRRGRSHSGGLALRQGDGR